MGRGNILTNEKAERSADTESGDDTTQIRMSPGEPDGSMDVTQERANEPEHKLAQFTQLKRKKLKKRSGASGLTVEGLRGDLKNVAKTLSDLGKHVHFLFSSFEL